MQEVRSRSAEWEVFPDAPAQEWAPAPQHRSGWEKTTGQETAQVRTLETPNPALSQAHQRHSYSGQFLLETGTETIEGCLFLVNGNMPTSTLGKARPSGLWSWAIRLRELHLPPSHEEQRLDSTSSAPAFNTPIGRPGPQISSLWKSAGPVPWDPSSS